MSAPEQAFARAQWKYIPCEGEACIDEIDVAWFYTLDETPTMVVLDPTEDDNSYNSWAHGVAKLSGGSIRVAGNDYCGGRPGPGHTCTGGPTCHPYDDSLYWTIGAGAVAELARLSTCGAYARGVNASDEFVGLVYNSSGVLRAGFWSGTGASVCDLGAVMPTGQSGNDSRAQAINDATPPMVVGWDEDTTTGLLWIQSGTGTCPADWEVINLNATGSAACWRVREVHDVNNNGWIVAIAERIDEGPGSPGPDDYPDRRVVLIRNVGGVTGCPADLTDIDGVNGCPDGEINIFDLFILLGNWDTDGLGDITDNNYGPPDGVINVFDLFALLSAWGPCGDALGFIPEDEQDCIDTYGFGEENRDKLESCLEAVWLMNNQ